MAKHMEGCPKSFSYVQHLKKNIYIYTYKCKYSDFAYMPYCCSNVWGSQEDEC